MGDHVINRQLGCAVWVGGGFGGSAIALIQASKTTETIRAVEKAFADKKFKAPRFFTSLPSQGAEVIAR